MSDHTHVFCPGCREDSDRLAALREGLREIICDLYEDGPPMKRMDKAVNRARALLVVPAGERAAREAE